MDAPVIIAIVAAAISVGALAATLWQAQIAKQQAATAEDQASSARAQVAESRVQTELQERIRRDGAQPYVWVDFRLDPGHAFIVRVHLENNGPTVARDVHVTFEPPLPNLGHNWDVMRYTAFREGFASLPPGRVMEWNLATGPELLNADIPQRYSITITGRGPYGPMEPLKYELGLAEWKNLEATPPGSLHEIKKSITDLVKAMSKR